MSLNHLTTYYKPICSKTTTFTHTNMRLIKTPKGKNVWISLSSKVIASVMMHHVDNFDLNLNNGFQSLVIEDFFFKAPHGSCILSLRHLHLLNLFGVAGLWSPRSNFFCYILISASNLEELKRTGTKAGLDVIKCESMSTSSQKN